MLDSLPANCGDATMASNCGVTGLRFDFIGISHSYSAAEFTVLEF